MSDAETYLRGKYGAYRGHFAWREIEEAFNAGAARNPGAGLVPPTVSREHEFAIRDSSEANAILIWGPHFAYSSADERVFSHGFRAGWGAREHPKIVAMLSAAPDAPQPAESSKHFAPGGYFEKLGAAIKSVPRLPAQSTEFDPPIEPLEQPASQAVMQQALDALLEAVPCTDKQMADQQNAIADLRTAIAQAVQPADPMTYLANGTRFKISKFTYGICITGLPEDLAGRWVALVAAEDDCHIKPKASHDQ